MKEIDLVSKIKKEDIFIKEISVKSFNNFISVTVYGKYTYDNIVLEEVVSGVSRCSPSDVYDFYYGYKIARGRAIKNLVLLMNSNKHKYAGERINGNKTFEFKQ